MNRWSSHYVAALCAFGAGLICLASLVAFALPLPGYVHALMPVGLLGAHRRLAGRLTELQVEGMPEAALARLHAPIGLDIGGILAYGGGGIHCITQQIPAVL